MYTHLTHPGMFSFLQDFHPEKYFDIEASIALQPNYGVFLAGLVLVKFVPCVKLIIDLSLQDHTYYFYTHH